MNFLEQFVPNATIVVICMLIGIWLKQAYSGDEKRLANIPWILGVAGAVLGVAGSFILTDLQGMDVLTAMAEGIVSGLAAGGAYQVIHQQDKLKNKNDDWED